MAILSAPAHEAAAQTLTTLYSGEIVPRSRLSIDASGTLYGTAPSPYNSEWSLVRLVNEGSFAAPSYTLEGIISYEGLGSFQPGPAQLPGVILDGAGNIYGTTPLGGLYNAGTVFRLDGASFQQDTLFDFGADGSTGRTPSGTLLRDASGTLFGTTSASVTQGQGTFFRLSPNGGGGYSHTVLGTGGVLAGEIAMDAAGSLYSTSTTLDGAGRRYVTRLLRNANGSYTPGGFIAYYGAQEAASAGVVIDDQNRLFALDGSVVRADLAGSLNPTGFLYRSIGDSTASGGLLIDPVGNIFGTTSTTAFRLSPDGHGNYGFTTLAELPGQSVAGLVADGDGNLYGTTIADGGLDGTVFRISDAGYGVAPQVALPVATPEPASLALLGLGAAMLAATRRRLA